VFLRLKGPDWLKAESIVVPQVYGELAQFLPDIFIVAFYSLEKEQSHGATL
jgi:hypothetical protein